MFAERQLRIIQAPLNKFNRLADFLQILLNKIHAFAFALPHVIYAQHSKAMAVHFKITQILEFVPEFLLSIFSIPSGILKHLRIIHGIIAYCRPMPRNRLAAKGKLLSFKIHHAILTVFNRLIRLFLKAKTGNSGNAVMIARPHLCVIAVGSRPPCAKAIISPARSHIAALMHLAVFPYFMIYSHHVLIKNPCGYLRIGISREAHLHSIIINRKFKPGRKQIVLRVKSKQRMRNF